MESLDSEITNQKNKKQYEESTPENSDNHVNSVDVDDFSETNDSEQALSNDVEKMETSDIDGPCEPSEILVLSLSDSDSIDGVSEDESPAMEIEASECSNENDSKASDCDLSVDEKCEDEISNTVNRLISMVESTHDASSKTAVTDSLNCPTFPIAANINSENELASSEGESVEANICKDGEATAGSLKNNSDGCTMESIVDQQKLVSDDFVKSETNEKISNQLTNKNDGGDQKSETVQQKKPVFAEINCTESDIEVCDEDDGAVSVDSDGDNCNEFLLETENKTKSDSAQDSDVSSLNKNDSKSQLSGDASTKINESNHIHDECKPVHSDEPLDMSVMQSEEGKLNVENVLQKSTQECSSNTSSCSNPEQAQSFPKDSVDESVVDEKNSRKVSSESLSNEETGFPEFLKDHVTIGRYDPVMGDFTLKSNEALIDCPSLIAPFLVKEPDVFPSSESKSRDNNGFFNSSVGNFLIGIGFSRVREWYHHDMSRIKSRRIKKSGKTDELVQELKNHQTHYLQAKKANEHFSLSYKKCKMCDYVTESSIALEGHMLAPHVTSKREYLCGYCSYLHRDPKDMLIHMKDSHDKVGHIEPPSLSYECYCCIFETNSRVKLNTHLGRCLKYFNHSRNQCPMKDVEFPCLTPKPITVSIVKSYEKSIASVMPSRGRPKKNDGIADYFNPQSHLYSGQPFASNQGQFRPGMNTPLSDGSHNQLTPRTDHLYPHANNTFGTGLHHLGNNYLQGMNSLSPMSNTPSAQYPHAGPKKAKKSFTSNSFGNASLLGGMHPFVKELPPGMPQPPRLQGPYSTQMNKDLMSPNVPHHPHNLVVCEICDGYIKDLEQLRMHMQLIHKVKIHPKMLTSRPPLNCQKCLWRFFTDHGLERHLLGAHGLVTSNMQELANKNKDTGCCTICGRVYASKLVAHMNQVHKIALKPAHLSYKCTVCSATFGLYRLFENHVYLVHAGGTKRSSSENSPVPKKSLKLNKSEKN